MPLKIFEKNLQRLHTNIISLLRLSFNLFYVKIVSMVKRAKLFLIIFCLLFSGTISSRTLAFEFSRGDLTASIFSVIGGVHDFVSFFSDTVIGKVRNDFCGNYFSSLASGEWKTTEFRVSLGSKICTEKVAVKIDVADKKNNVQSNNAVSVDISKKTPDIKTPVVSKIQNIIKKVETSGLLVGKTVSDGAKINKTQIVSLTNVERVKKGLQSLAGSSKLDAVAEKRVLDMFAKGYFEHVSPSGDSASLVADREGYRYIVVGENIALGNFDNTQALINAWMNSEGHRKNILHTAYTEIGVYAKESQYKGQKVWISAQIFGRPLSSCIEPDSKERAKIDSIQASITDMKARAAKNTLELKTLNTTENPNLYNSKVAEYNLLISVINSSIKEIGVLATKYNNEVKTFNECIKLP
ncbi:MAG: CAP domain-containing protein [Candidatus Paceibacterota bacterium]|jgi:uncharacterized protein YkwD